MREDIGTVEIASLLYDFYGGLLGEKQEEVMNLYHEDNLSLSEIAEELGLSRQAVHYTLKKAENSLEEYENKLGLLKKYRENEKQIADICARLESIAANERLSENGRQEIKNIIHSVENLAE